MPYRVRGDQLMMPGDSSRGQSSHSAEGGRRLFLICIQVIAVALFVVEPFDGIIALLTCGLRRRGDDEMAQRWPVRRSGPLFVAHNPKLAL